MVYMMQGDYPIALNYFFKALEISNVTGNKQYQSSNRENIGIIYTYQHKYAEALIQFEASLKILKEIGNAVSYTHLRAHETVLDLVCRLLLEKKNNKKKVKKKNT